MHTRFMCEIYSVNKDKITIIFEDCIFTEVHTLFSHFVNTITKLFKTLINFKQQF